MSVPTGLPTRLMKSPQNEVPPRSAIHACRRINVMTWRRVVLSLPALSLFMLSAASLSASDVDQFLNEENKQHKITTNAMPVVDDWTFLRRVYVDLIGRIPTNEEINEFRAWPTTDRRNMVIDKLLKDERYADRM